MNRSPLLSLAALLLLPLLLACNVEHPAPSSAVTFSDVTFNWTSEGPSCGGDVHFHGIRAIVVGEKRNIDNNYPCTDAPHTIIMHDFADGTYNYTLSTIDSGEGCLYRKCVTYTARGTFTVQGGDLQMDVRLVL